MRTFLLLLTTILFTGTLLGQVSFSEDFESYNVGDGIAASSDDFELWPGGVATDAPITDALAASGEKSLHLPGNQDLDILLLFGDQYTEGTFDMNFDVYIPEGANTYFNFQGSDQIPSDDNWSLQCFLNANGIFEVDNGESIVFANAYEQDKWINIRLNVNLTENLWRMYIDGVCLGSFVNLDLKNRVYALNLYPIDGFSDAYVDNIAFEYNPVAEEVVIELDAAAAFAEDTDAGIGLPQASFFGISGRDQGFSVSVRNDGSETIETFDLAIEGAGLSSTETITQTIAPGETISIPVDSRVTYTDGQTFALYNITSVNGVDDDNTCNNSTPLSFFGITPAADKKVFVEESTGRGCQFCPRGHVYMNYMADKYPELFVGAAVHTDDFGLDPMTNTEWDSGLTAFTGQPSLWVNRDPALLIDPSQVEIPFLNALLEEPIVFLDHQGRYDEATRTLDLQVRTEFEFTSIPGSRLFVGLIENGVQGQGAGYAQTNAYANGALGPMGGYENLPSPVPATEMVYNDVARLAITGGLGLENAYQNVDGNVIVHNFVMEIPADWNTDNMYIVSAFLGPDGRAFNAQKTTISEAVANGYTNTVDPILDQGISVFPNPTQGNTVISLDFEAPTQVTMDVTSATGKLISTENLGTISGETTINYDGTQLQAGIYYLNFRSGTQTTIKRLMITE